MVSRLSNNELIETLRALKEAQDRNAEVAADTGAPVISTQKPRPVGVVVRDEVTTVES